MISTVIKNHNDQMKTKKNLQMKSKTRINDKDMSKKQIQNQVLKERQ